jgi:hypothetical protein
MRLVLELDAIHLQHSPDIGANSQRLFSGLGTVTPQGLRPLPPLWKICFFSTIGSSGNILRLNLPQNLLSLGHLGVVKRGRCYWIESEPGEVKPDHCK